MINLFRSLAHMFCIFLLASCASQKIGNVSYIDNSIALDESFPELNVFKPKRSENCTVVIFIHGGYWDEGNKNMYDFLGRNFAKKNIVSVIPDYTLSPDGNYETMAMEVAAAIQWTNANIAKYSGNPDQIFLMGHSAGGHLIALVGTNPKYLKNPDLIKGIILNDAAGLDMYSYLKRNPPTKDHHYNITWTENPENWKDASPIFSLSEKAPPFLIYVGTKTFLSIISQNKDFVEKLNKYQPSVKINFLPKRHIPMMSQFIFPFNKHYGEIIEFMNAYK